MKRIIYIICGVFLLTMITENINLIYAENNEETNEEFNGIDSDNNEWLSFSSDKTIDYNDIINFADIPSNDNIITNGDEYTSEELMELQYNLSNQAKIEEKQIFEVEQTEQYIDTSDYGIIRIVDPENSRKGITIHDRNLGATTTGAGENSPDTSYGYSYQRGNNYGFPATGSIEKVVSYSETDIDASEYGPSTYSSDTFIIGNNDWSHISNDNLRGGSGDSAENGRGYPINNSVERQGPCPTGYHVPSIGEWSKLLNFWANEYGNVNITTKDGLSQFTSQQPNAFKNFYQRFLIPLPNFSSYFHSSTPDVLNNGLYRMQLRTNYWIWANSKSEARADGYPIRCFLNSYRLPKIITYRINGGYWSGEDEIQEKSIIYTSDDGVNYIPNKTLGIVKRNDNCGENDDKKCMFAGWYTLTGDELWTGDMSEDITVYTRWLSFEDKDISISRVNFTVMDRNLGAINPGITENAYGYYLSGLEDGIMCPEGYHIPSTGERLGIGKLLGDNFSGDYIKDLVNLPFAGKINNAGNLEDEGSGYYLARNGDELMYAKINNSGIQIENLNDGEKLSVRCFKNYNTGTIKFYSNGGNNIADIAAVNWRENGEDLEKPSREHSIFSGWYTTSNFQDNSKLERNINYKNEKEINLYAKWDCEEGYQKNGNSCEQIYFDIQRIDGNGNIIKTDSVKWGETPVYNGTTPTKSATSNYSYTFNGMWIPEIIAAFENTGYIAQFSEEIIRKSGGNSSGGGGRKTSVLNEHASADDIISGMNDKDLENNSNINYLNDNSKGQSGTKLSSGLSTNNLETLNHINPLGIDLGGEKLYSQEFVDAYNFAYKYGITDANSIYDAKMYSPITRIEMAKMLSYYAINVLGKNPDISKGTIKFNDVTDEMNAKYNNGIVLAYQFGIMGQNVKDNKFRPNDEITRAEFVTALSRLLYGTEDGTGNIKYYEPHSAKLYNEGIINKTDPAIKEKRGYVMTMLMRTVQ